MPSLAPFPSSPVTRTSTKRFLRILYAEDVPELREIARISFHRDGHGIECVEDGLAACHRVLADPNFDLVITDHHMPNMNGLEFVRRLREMEFPGRILVFTSDTSEAVAAEYARLNVDRMLYKPVYPSVLREVLGELFPSAARSASQPPFRLSPPLPRA
jgi:two-component system, chemotaxis family, chemotaxis protein CheY